MYLFKLTLAARLESNDLPNQSTISYQYLCINITSGKRFQPCFRTSNVIILNTPYKKQHYNLLQFFQNQTSLSYKINLENSDNNNCFLSQPIRVVNIDEWSLYNYYLVSISSMYPRRINGQQAFNFLL
jgi:hypothetical protein